MRSLAKVLLAIGLATCMLLHPAEPGSVPTGILIRGTVIYPDGSPASGATVHADPICGNEFSFPNQTQTIGDGTFAMPTIDSSCGRLRITAEKPDAFWLRTGEGIFYPRINGTAPEIALSPNGTADPVTVKLDLRGGTLHVTALDLSSGHNLSVTLMIECLDKPCGAVVFGTGTDGAGSTQFLPARKYQVSLYGFSCGTETYQADQGPSTTVEVVERQLRSAVLGVNLKAVRARTTWYQPKEFPCGE